MSAATWSQEKTTCKFSPQTSRQHTAGMRPERSDMLEVMCRARRDHPRVHYRGRQPSGHGGHGAGRLEGAATNLAAPCFQCTLRWWRPVTASVQQNDGTTMRLQVEKGAIVAAGALVTPGTVVPSGEPALLLRLASHGSHSSAAGVRLLPCMCVGAMVVAGAHTHAVS